MDENLEKLIDGIILERLSYYGDNAPDEKDGDSLMSLDSAYKALYASLNEEQKRLSISVENGYSLLRGEVEAYYFRAGISDGIAIVMGFLQK